MRHYEIVLLVHSDQSDQVPAIIKRYVTVVKASQGKIHRTEDWGRKQLAYPIAKTHKAHYVLMNIECNPAVLNELSELFRYNDAILRDMVIATSQAFTKPSPMKITDNQEERARKKEQERDGRQGGERGERERNQSGADLTSKLEVKQEAESTKQEAESQPTQSQLENASKQGEQAIPADAD